MYAASGATFLFNTTAPHIYSLLMLLRLVRQEGSTVKGAKLLEDEVQLLDYLLHMRVKTPTDTAKHIQRS